MEKVYGKRKTSDLMNSLLCYELCKRKVVVDNSHWMYETSKKVLGSWLTDTVVKGSMGKVFTGGDNLASFESNLRSMNAMGIPVIGNYSIEAKEGEEFTPAEMDLSAEEYINYLDTHQKYLE